MGTSSITGHKGKKSEEYECFSYQSVNLEFALKTYSRAANHCAGGVKEQCFFHRIQTED